MAAVPFRQPGIPRRPAPPRHRRDSLPPRADLAEVGAAAALVHRGRGSHQDRRGSEFEFWPPPPRPCRPSGAGGLTRSAQSPEGLAGSPPARLACPAASRPPPATASPPGLVSLRRSSASVLLIRLATACCVTPGRSDVLLRLSVHAIAQEDMPVRRGQLVQAGGQDGQVLVAGGLVAFRRAAEARAFPLSQRVRLARLRAVSRAAFTAQAAQPAADIDLICPACSRSDRNTSCMASSASASHAACRRQVASTIARCFCTRARIASWSPVLRRPRATPSRP